MPMVRVEPAGLELDVIPGEAVIEAAWRQGYSWPTQCWGQAECMVCYTKVIAGEAHVAPANDFEVQRMASLLPRQWQSPTTRLACQLRITGPGVVLEKRGVRAPP